MKSLLKLTLCAALIGGLAACGGGEQTNCSFTGSLANTTIEQSGNVGKPYSFTPIKISGAPSGCKLSFSASDLPPGLTINTVDGLVSGTPITAGSFKSRVAAGVKSKDGGDGETRIININYTIGAATASASNSAE